jgi:hypothetical protein
MSFWSTCARNQSHNQIEYDGDLYLGEDVEEIDRNIPSCRACLSSVAVERKGEVL